MIFKDKKGFTLIEVIVCIAIIAMIGVILSGILSTTIKARNVSQERLQTLALCSSYINEIKSKQNEFSTVNDLESWLQDNGFSQEINYLQKTDSNINIKIYINQNLHIEGLFEVKIIGKSINASELSISTVIKGDS